MTLRQNGGPGVARNAGFAQAHGVWLAVLDADDAFTPMRLERLLAASSATECEMLADNVLLRSPEGDQTLFAEGGEGLTIDAAAFLKQSRRTRGQGRAQFGFLKPMIRRDFLVRHGITYLPMRLAEDHFMVLSCLIAGARWHVIAEPLYIYNLRGDSLTATFKPDAVDAIAAANASLLRDPRVKSNAFLARSIAEDRDAAAKAALWTRLVSAVRSRRWRQAFGLSLQSRSAVGAVAWGLGETLRRRSALGLVKIGPNARKLLRIDQALRR